MVHGEEKVAADFEDNGKGTGCSCPVRAAWLMNDAGGLIHQHALAMELRYIYIIFVVMMANYYLSW